MVSLPLRSWLSSILRVLRTCFHFFEPPDNEYWLTRIVFLRGLGLVYAVAFFSLSWQLTALFGDGGLLPVGRYLQRIAGAYPSTWSAFGQLPTLFWIDASDDFMAWICRGGLALSGIVALGYANAPIMAVLWFVYMSFVHVGQVFYSFGWEILLLEAGFLAIFLSPAWNPNLITPRSPPPKVVIWLLRWVVFRVMFGAGMIKIRGDECWRDLTCLMYHLETQPIPNPISWYWHQTPPLFHKIEVLGNHVVELIVPWAVFGPRYLRVGAGMLLIAFQLALIVSGNLSWLNWLTIVLCISCFDDSVCRWLFTRRTLDAVGALPRPTRLWWPRVYVLACLCALVVYLSVAPVRNLLSDRQQMNSSFDRLHLVNTYGAFGHVGKERYEIILSGTTDPYPSANSRWIEYEFPCKPGSPERRPCVISPFHYRLDWHIWFAAMSDIQRHPWLAHLVYQLLRGDEDIIQLLDGNPFPDGPPRFIRADLYRYEFTRYQDNPTAWWTRTRVGAYFPPLSLNNPSLIQFLRFHGMVE